MQRPLPPISPAELRTFSINNLAGGWNENTNQDSISDTEISDGRNVEITGDDTIEPRKGISIRGNYLGNTTKILGMEEYVKPSTGARKLVCAYNTDAYVLNVDWEPAGLTLTTNKPAEFANFLDRLYMTNKGNTEAGALGVTYFDGTTWTQVTGFPKAAATSSDTAAGLCVYKERLIAWNTVNNPRRVYYSGQNAHTIGANDYFDVDEPVVVCVPLFDYLLVFTENKIYRIGSFIFTNIAFEPNSIIPLPTQIGCIAQRTAKVVGQFCYFISKVGLMRTDGLNVQNISDAKVKDYLGSTVSRTILTNSCAGVDNQYYRLQLSVGGTVQDEMLTYDTNRNIYFPRSDNFNISCFATFSEANAVGFYGGSDTDGTILKFGQSTYADELVTASSLTAATTNNAIDAASGAVKRCAQSFTLSNMETLTQVALSLKKNAGTTTGLTVRIETDDSGKPSGTLADSDATGTITAFAGTTYLFKHVVFASSFSLVPGTYWIVCQHTTEGAGNSQYYWGSDSAGAYTGGNLATYASSAWTAVAAHDGLFLVYYQSGYEKYFITKGYPLGYPQFQKIVKRVFIELESSGNYFATVGINTDLYTSFKDVMVSLLGNSPIRGSSLTRGAFTRGTQLKANTFVRFSGTRGRRIKLRVYNNTAGQKFTFHSAVLNYIVKKIAR
jgi:hypothetical protein